MKCGGWFRDKHDFGKWFDHAEGEITRSHDNVKVGMVIYQKRKCEKCNFVELDKQEVML